MKKLTPSQKLKQLKKSGWLDFAEWMMANAYSAYDLDKEEHAITVIQRYRQAHTVGILSRSIERDMFDLKESFMYGNIPKMIGLSEQVNRGKRR